MEETGTKHTDYLRHITVEKDKRIHKVAEGWSLLENADKAAFLHAIDKAFSRALDLIAVRKKED